MDSAVTLLQDQSHISHHTLNVLPLYTVKLSCANCIGFRSHWWRHGCVQVGVNRPGWASDSEANICYA